MEEKRKKYKARIRSNKNLSVTQFYYKKMNPLDKLIFKKSTSKNREVIRRFEKDISSLKTRTRALEEENLKLNKKIS